jgi:protein-tyrosine-phosphatase
MRPSHKSLAMRIQNLLFLCTGNSARSILAEAILNHEGAGRFRAFSAGSHPKGEVHPAALKLLGELGFDTGGYRSKSWDEFAAHGAPSLDFIVTVCDNAAGEVCPIWPGRPATGHWGIEDPAAVEESRQPQAFRVAYDALQRRIDKFLAIPFDTIDDASLKARIREIGEIDEHHGA